MEASEVRKKRKEMGLSQAQMAAILRVGVRQYQRYEKGFLYMPVIRKERFLRYYMKHKKNEDTNGKEKHNT